MTYKHYLPPDETKAEPPAPSWFVGLDLGQASDYSAVCVIERTEQADTPSKFACRHLERYNLGTPYPAIVASVAKLLTLPTLRGAALVVDGTGVGRAVVDMFRATEIVASLAPVIITGGTSTSFDDTAKFWHVPKKELVSVLQMLMQTKRLSVAKSLPLAATLQKELLAFKVKITSAGNETFEAWRERDHDDLVLSLAIALWYAERNAGGRLTGDDPRDSVMSRLLDDLHDTQPPELGWESCRL